MPRRREGYTNDVSHRVQREFGRRLQAARKRSGNLQKVLATHLYLSRTSISNIERGAHRVYLDQVYAAARALCVDVVELLPSLDDIYPRVQVHTAVDDPLPAGVAAQAGALARDVQRHLANRSKSSRRKDG